MQIDRHLLYIASRAIEARLKLQKLRVPSWDECRAADNVGWKEPSQVGCYYDICFRTRDTPTQEEFVAFYLRCHENKAPASWLLDAMSARVARSYNSLVAEHHLLALCIESGRFDACYKAESLDLAGMVDLVVRIGANQAGFAIQVPTRGGSKWLQVKRKRQEKRGHPWEWPLLNIMMDFNRMQEVAGIHLFTPRWVPTLWERATQTYMPVFQGEKAL